MFGHFQWKSWTEHNINVRALLIHRSGEREKRGRVSIDSIKQQNVADVFRCHYFDRIETECNYNNNKKRLLINCVIITESIPLYSGKRKKRNGFSFQNPPLCEHTITSIERLSLLEIWWIFSTLQNLLNYEGVVWMCNCYILIFKMVCADFKAFLGRIQVNLQFDKIYRKLTLDLLRCVN